MNIIAYITVNILLFASWYIFLSRYKELFSFIDRIISTFILSLTQIVLTEIILGVLFKKLYAAQLLWLNIVLSSAILVYALTVRSIRAEGICRHHSESILSEIFKEILGKTVWFVRVLKNDLILLIIFILFIILLCWTAFMGYLFPSYTWDALWYHLPIAGYIMQSGAIQEIPNNSFIEQFINIFPKNIELFFLWNIIFLENDAVTDLSQILFAIIGVLTIYTMAVKLSVGRRSAMYSSLLFFFTPIMILQSTTNYVDVAVAVLFLIAINFLIDNNIGQSPFNSFIGKDITRHAHTVMAALTTGLLLGSKGSGPLFVGILSVAVIIRELIWRFQSFKKDEKGILIKIALRSFTFYLIFFFMPVILMGGYWYIKNWVVYGNPVYPMEISIFNNTIFKGLYQGIVEPAPEIINKLHPAIRPLYVWMDRVEYYLYDSRLGGLGPIWFILFIPSIVFSFLYCSLKKHYRFIALLLMITAAFLMYPRNWNPRYVIFIIGLGAISFAIVIDFFYERQTMIRIIAIFLTVYTFLISNSPCITPKQIKQFIQLPADERTIGMHAPFNIDLHARQEYGYWMWISRNITKGEILGYTFEPLFLSPMWNSAFSSKIVYIKSSSFAEWLKTLDEKNVTYILVRRNSNEDKWIESRGAAYQTLFSDGNYKIAKVVRNES